MTRSLRAPAVPHLWLAAVVVCAIAAGAQRDAVAQQPPSADLASSTQVVRLFDFNERPLGNFEDTPMYWQRMTGDGLPAYSGGQLDEQIGHAAPPSFRFKLRGGNIGYEYQRDDLPVLPDSDYLIEAYVRAAGLQHARAFIAAHLVDAGGQRIAGSECVSQLVQSERSPGMADDPPWQRLRIPLHVDEPLAAALRLQLWVLQTYVFDERQYEGADPITPQDVNARVWFDDLTILRLPRVGLSLSNPGGLIKPGARETVRVSVQNTTPATLTAELTVLDPSDTACLRTTLEVEAGAATEQHIPVPSLPPGTYRTVMQIYARDQTSSHADRTPLTGRTVRFAVLPEVPGSSTPGPDFGVDLGVWPRADAAGAAELVASLGCGAVKVGLPLVDIATNGPDTERLRQARDLAQRLALLGIETTAVALPPAALPSARPLTTYEVVATDDGWEEQLGPMLACFGGHLSALQLGAEATELQQPFSWDAAALDRVHRGLERFAEVPPIVLPRAVFDAAATPALLDPSGVAPANEAADSRPSSATAANGFGGYSFWVPADLPAQSLPWQLAFWLDEHGGSDPAVGDEDTRTHREGSANWVSLGLHRAEYPSAPDHLTDLARRVVLAKAVNPARVYVPAPFAFSGVGDGRSWQPTEDYIPLRTLFRALCGAHAVAGLTRLDDAVGILFEHGQQHTLVAWTWRDEPDGVITELYTGPSASVLELTGTVRPLEIDGLRARVTLGPSPILVQNVDGALLQLQDSFHVDPTFLESHGPQPGPVLTLGNPYARELSGTIELTAPATWQVTPNPIRLELAAGECLSQTLSFDIPARQVRSEVKLAVLVHVERPERVTLQFEVPLRVGLRDITTEVSPWWDGDDLVVRQSLRNLSDQAVSFNAFCQPQQRAQLEGVFLRVPPGEAAVHTYRLARARELVGTQLWLGIEEIGGRRSLDQLVAVPP